MHCSGHVGIEIGKKYHGFPGPLHKVGETQAVRKERERIRK